MSRCNLYTRMPSDTKVRIRIPLADETQHKVEIAAIRESCVRNLLVRHFNVCYLQKAEHRVVFIPLKATASFISFRVPREKNMHFVSFIIRNNINRPRFE